MYARRVCDIVGVIISIIGGRKKRKVSGYNMVVLKATACLTNKG